ncbi:hypothetical protein BDV95DRAFT_368351 [Massariosphaeria phaeospora]|uniref:F-box domain-containing protein n=1 Tax=Massariosphaeria phaeospora TaxID=100035 RepID=A0A7C8ICX7_9PLEO|nr:hypothetical protein BDV95DRAFT_368351 [Massariosphaeria phaeospora]
MVTHKLELRGYGPETSRTREEISAHIRQLGIQCGGRWLKNWARQPAKLELAILLTPAHNLEFVEIRGAQDFAFDDPMGVYAIWYSFSDPDMSVESPVYLEALIQAAQRLPDTPTRHDHHGKLHTIDVEFFGSWYSDLAWLLLLPSLRRLRLKNTDGEFVTAPYEFVDPWPIARQTSTLEEIEFEKLQIFPECLVNIISSCKALTSFYHYRGAENTRVDCQTEILALQAHGNTLKKLDFRPCGSRLEQDRLVPPLDGFHHLHALESI